MQADDLLNAVSSLCLAAQGIDGMVRARKMVALLIDRLRPVDRLPGR